MHSTKLSEYISSDPILNIEILQNGISHQTITLILITDLIYYNLWTNKPTFKVGCCWLVSSPKLQIACFIVDYFSATTTQ